MTGKRLSLIISVLVVCLTGMAQAQTLDDVEIACEQDEPLEACTEAVQALMDGDPDASDTADAFWARALRYHAEPDHRADAISDYTTLLEIRPSSGVYYNRAQLLRFEGKEDEALADLRRAVKIAPNYGRAWLDISLILADSGQYPEAIQAATNAIERDAELEDSFKSMAWNNRGNSERQTGRLDEARASLTRAAGLDPQNAVARRNLVRVYILMKDRQHAGETLAVAEQLDPGNSVNPELKAAIAEIE